jgi:hypothetical protein
VANRSGPAANRREGMRIDAGRSLLDVIGGGSKRTTAHRRAGGRQRSSQGVEERAPAVGSRRRRQLGFWDLADIMLEVDKGCSIGLKTKSTHL